MSGRRYVLLDRDGTVIADRGYVHRVEDLMLLPGAIEGLTALRDAGFRLAIVTNQSGIGRGYFTEADFQRFQMHLTEVLSQHGIAIDATYHCPHRPDAGCRCRKPSIELVSRAERELGADLAQSWIIGDSEVDMALAARAGCRAVRIGAPQSACSAGAMPASPAPPSVLFATDLRAAAAAILARLP